MKTLGHTSPGKGTFGASGRRRARAWLTQGVAAAAVLALLAGSAKAEDYELGPQDKLRVNIVEWAFDDVRSPLTGEFSVGPGGTLSLPLIGSVPAAGLTPDVVAEDISRRLQAKLGLATPPSTAVEVTEFRPFYLLGDVDRPGEYAFRPGMTVLQAVSLGGGLPRSGVGPIDAERNALAAVTELRTATAGIDALSAQLARLEAEAAEAGDVAFPDALTARRDDPAIAHLLRAETILFEARRDSMISEEEGRAEMAKLRQEEVASLREHVAALESQHRAVQALLDDVRALKAKGLAAPSRELDLERTAADVLGRRLDVEARAIQALQEQTRARDTANQTRLERERQLGEDLRRTRTGLDEMQLRRDAAERLVRLTRDFVAAGAPLAFSIIRAEPGRSAERGMAASHATPVRPGDVIEVRLGGPGAAPAADTPMADAAPDDDDAAPAPLSTANASDDGDAAARPN